MLSLMEVYSMTDTTPLSPAAQAVLKAACIHHGLFNEEIIQRRRMLAAALRAAADQVVPKTPPPKFAPHYEEGIWDGKDDAREQLLAIAAELEGANDH